MDKLLLSGIKQSARNLCKPDDLQNWPVSFVVQQTSLVYVIASTN
jgi:hypothetical protein